jgi:hypothetical protein
MAARQQGRKNVFTAFVDRSGAHRRDRVPLSFGQIRSALERIAPQARLGDWAGPINGPALDPGIKTLSAQHGLQIRPNILERYDLLV